MGVSGLTCQLSVRLCSELNTLVLKGEAVDLCSYIENTVKKVLNNIFNDSNDIPQTTVKSKNFQINSLEESRKT